LRSRLASVAARRALKAVNHLAGPDHVQFFARELFQIMIVSADATDALAQRFILFLQAIVLLVESAFLAAQPPQMERAAFTDDGDHRKQDDKRAK